MQLALFGKGPACVGVGTTAGSGGAEVAGAFIEFLDLEGVNRLIFVEVPEVPIDDTTEGGGVAGINTQGIFGGGVEVKGVSFEL